MFKNFEHCLPERPRKTVQTQKQSDQGLSCLLSGQAFWYCPDSQHFFLKTEKIVQNLRPFTVHPNYLDVDEFSMNKFMGHHPMFCVGFPKNKVSLQYVEYLLYWHNKG